MKTILRYLSLVLIAVAAGMMAWGLTHVVLTMLSIDHMFEDERALWASLAGMAGAWLIARRFLGSRPFHLLCVIAGGGLTLVLGGVVWRTLVHSPQGWEGFGAVVLAVVYSYFALASLLICLAGTAMLGAARLARKSGNELWGSPQPVFSETRLR